MKILYVILSCNNYVDTRCPSSENTWLTKINDESDYVILSADSLREKVIGYQTRDDYWSLPDKMLNFFTKFDFKDYEWVLTLDDDAFCFPSRLENYLLKNNFDCNDNITIGQRSCYFAEMDDTIFCGGGGTIVSRGCINLLKEFLDNEVSPIRYLCGDCSMFDWFKKINSQLIHAINDDGQQIMFPNKYQDSDSGYLNSAITYHYCDENDKNYLFENFLK
jgi:hypothetical protein